jgi:hypothetical protein
VLIRTSPSHDDDVAVEFFLGSYDGREWTARLSLRGRLHTLNIGIGTLYRLAGEGSKIRERVF